MQELYAVDAKIQYLMRAHFSYAVQNMQVSQICVGYSVVDGVCLTLKLGALISAKALGNERVGDRLRHKLHKSRLFGGLALAVAA